jgi:A/G-specific adenine glycosylase
MGRNASKSESDETAPRLLAWYDRHARTLPWRAPPGRRPDPYAVWLSEIMLQQTTVAAVKAYFERFLARWPTVETLAAATPDEVMRLWAGLGYYSRARNLHACAKEVAASGGRFPETEPALRALPGIGPYTAAAIAAIAFDQRATVVDGNVERVIARLDAIEVPLRAAKSEIRERAAVRTPHERCGDYAQAMMDLGATICTPRRPACVLCPLSAICRARASGQQDVLPLASPKPERPSRFGSIFYIRRAGEVLVRTRPAKGLLGGMTEFPGTDWATTAPAATPPIKASYRRLIAPVTHGFTHFELALTVFVGEVAARSATPDDCRWVPENRLAEEALPSLMRKVAAAAQAAPAAAEAS